ncbi:MAG: endonuclease MutS2 [Gemmatimonadaceae bacterium]|nr:endonuclease MutS2 [Gemmatimonadaceae bacterium]NUO96102.1 endonuclease MutS2 [Gemmatimonadaceae bacterium]NUP56356.1 endonuclease MutS2 [Gemmatimonadaceae bacterium]NUP73013.1 endonuclease MutS2 [Gemmatimonadaceae bacterium]NUR32619.1 endonuclease MutS2 [Gemmatimonadaceae bacterium]
MNAHALGLLEFPRLLELVAERATSAPGAARVRALTPSADLAWLEAEHRRVGAVRSLLGGEPTWSPEPVPELSGPINRLRVVGSVWNGAELSAGAVLLRSARRTRDALRDERRPALVRAVLASFAERMVAARGEEEAIERAVGEDGIVRDEASPTLRRIRRELRASHGELIRILERVMNGLEAHHRAPDMSVTLREGRYVIPVRREGVKGVGGIVHGTSSTGGTMFVEPPAAIEYGNRIRELEGEEQEEVERILLELTDRLRPHREALGDSLDALAELDSLHARARYAVQFECSPAELVAARAGFAIRDGRHPLLLAKGAAVVPFDLAMLPDERTLLVSGPNTGGKTVLLKALGLISVMSQAGIPAPVGLESRVPVFDDVLADIGDEQSIEASLSTFSAHLKNLSEILRRATADSLVLIDELGSGTDPQEGAALGWAVLETLTARRTTTLASTHLGQLKELATQVPGVVNASLQFDAVRLAPTYRLIKGIPGRSYGISIARRLELPAEVVARAEERMPQGERDMAALIERLERKEEELAARERDANAILEDARARAAAVARRETNVRQRERDAEKASRQEARRYVLEARAEIERTIKDLKKRGAEAADAALDAMGRDARRRAEELAAKQANVLDRLDHEERAVARKQSRPAGGTREALSVNDAVEVATLGGKIGRVIDVRGKEAVVAVGSMKLTVPLATLRRTEHQPAETAVSYIGDAPEVHVSTEVNLLGLRVDEAEGAVMQALDSAIRADLKSLRIIHGKGTGALRQVVDEMLRKDTRVREFHMGAWNEGGAGVTIAVFA